MLIEQARQLFDLEITPEQAQQFDIYAAELAEWNTRINLTAITEPDEVRVRHFLDSLAISRVIGFDPGDRIIDIGTGAGFPGMVLAIVFPHIEVTLMEATQKKLGFLEHVAQRLGLKNVHMLHARAEDAGQDQKHRAKYNIVTARAVARLPALLEYMLPLARVGGFCIAMKGSTAEEELNDSKRALYILNGEAKPLFDYQLPGLEHNHVLVTVEKTKATPRPYPRKPGTPTRKPIGF